MNFAVQHVHLKTRDPKQTAQFYVDNFGATLKGEIPGRGFRVDLHGLQLNITGLIAGQNHEQHYGIEHMAVQTDDYPGTLAQLQKERRAHPGGIAAEQRTARLLRRMPRRCADGDHRKDVVTLTQVVIPAKAGNPGDKFRCLLHVVPAFGDDDEAGMTTTRGVALRMRTAARQVAQDLTASRLGRLHLPRRHICVM